MLQDNFQSGVFLLTILRQVYVEVLWFHGLIWSNNFQISFLKIGIVYKNCSSEFQKWIIKFDIIRFVLLKFFSFKMWSCWEWISLLHPLSTGCTSERLHQLLIYRMNLGRIIICCDILLCIWRETEESTWNRCLGSLLTMNFVQFISHLAANRDNDLIET